ncbi:superoxide reductase [Methanohalophilus euhalobius]|jgi:superoxide reductase|uniref:Superoxide reductase n=1 Tax=Methanohalophilus euhalobius TaxID=51203 RepID=A0A285FSU1_9EURY|nr:MULTISPECIES: desulfoferrodoxin family protein [Methanohalophilus]ODV49778.1 MAG: superoxide reductase [Methanohalophilus sp. 2-GBenrich]RSD35628.1 MAG: superoxide reductase [Methanohalophilus sp.]TCL11475.1 superoxide reductase [Methanohalophilus euhalobius]SNY14390.1 superoxide reductase [Methanohalophilus euhalobius]
MDIEELIKGKVSEGKEKHVPDISISKSHGSDVEDLVTVHVGKEVAHPNTVEHHIVWLELYGVKGNGQVVDLGRAEFGPSFTEPLARFKLNVADFKAVFAMSYCNVHGLWQNLIEL